MKIRFLKTHLGDKIGNVEDVPEPLATYLIRVGVGEEVKDEPIMKEDTLLIEPNFVEKEEIAPKKEKKENKTGNVPTAKKRKK